MRFSESFIKTNKSASELDSINATLLTKGGFIEQTIDLFPFKKPLAHTASNFRFPFTVNMPGGNSRYRR